MSLVTALRRLWRKRVFVLAAMICASLVGVAITHQIPSLQSRQHQVGIASAAALIDSSRSQVADLSLDTSTDVGTLAERASLLADLMATSQIKDDIANLAGIPAAGLVATPPAPYGPITVTAAVPAVVSSISPSSPRASLLNISVPNLEAGTMPIIMVGTQAPTAALAARLANAAFTALEANVDSLAAADHVSSLHRLEVRPLGPAVSSVASQGPGMLDGILGAMAAFVLICGALLGAPALATAWRKASAAESGAIDARPEAVDPRAHVRPSASAIADRAPDASMHSAYFASDVVGSAYLASDVVGVQSANTTGDGAGHGQDQLDATP